MSNIIEFKINKDEIGPDTVLEKAVGQYSSVVVLGWSNEGFLDVRSSTNLNHADLNWLLSVVQHKLLSGDYSSS